MFRYIASAGDVGQRVSADPDWALVRAPRDARGKLALGLQQCGVGHVVHECDIYWSIAMLSRPIRGRIKLRRLA
jgi:hypothetical protein